MAQLAAIGALAASPQAAQALARQKSVGTFSRELLIDAARKRAEKPFEPLPATPKALAKLGYDQYREIRFNKNAALWPDPEPRFSLEAFAPGFLYREGVGIYVVESGEAYPVSVGSESFEAPSEEISRSLSEFNLFSGFRLHYPINKQTYADEFVVFQGASYFRMVSKGQTYGLSARGLALNVAEPEGEEFPIFRSFYVERPSGGQDTMVVHALLDSKSVTGAYRFGIYPGDPSFIEVDLVLFPREPLGHVGIAPLTSMYMHAPNDPTLPPDYRPRVHDSEGLAMLTGRGERLWRPLINPPTLQLSAFMDEAPKGFGLVQRSRDFDEYQDLEARYETRPSAWVVPQGDWGRGHVTLVEIPSASEANDNIVAYWRPEKPLELNPEGHRLGYRMFWPDDIPLSRGFGRVVRSAEGRTLHSRLPQFAIDYDIALAQGAAGVYAEVSTSAGAITETLIHDNAETGGVRVFVTLNPDGADFAELRLTLRGADGGALGETWLTRWLAR